MTESKYQFHQKQTAWALNISTSRLTYLRRAGRFPATGQDSQGYLWSGAAIMEWASRKTGKQAEEYRALVSERLRSLMYDNKTLASLHAPGGRPKREEDGNAVDGQ